MYDVFISHASEDKDGLVRVLAEALGQEDLEVWYDEHSLRPGDSLRQSIDRGLRDSRYGLVVLSPAFFRKQWPTWELNGLVQLHQSTDGGRILPIWHRVGHVDVIQYSPPLADIVAIRSELGLRYIVQQVMSVVRPHKTSIGYAQDVLKSAGYVPPPPTDEWWLDVVEYDGSDANSHRWSFFVGVLEDRPEKRGAVIARKAIQMAWQDRVEQEGISQMTHPDHLLASMRSVPGVADLLLEHLQDTIVYAPQLTIVGMGGEFEPSIELAYTADVLRRRPTRQAGESRFTVDGGSPTCGEAYALRDPEFGYHEAGIVACHFVQGDLFGPSPSVYEPFDYLIWLLSAYSDWVPDRIREYLLLGFKSWSAWNWSHSRLSQGSHEFEGALFHAMFEAARGGKTFEIDREVEADIRGRINSGASVMGIDVDQADVYRRFLEGAFIEAFIEEASNRPPAKS